MNWSDEGIVLSVRPHGETATVVELLTRQHGRHFGLVHGGRSRRMRPVLQIGNHVEATWKGRLAEHLGYFTTELRKGYAASVMEDPLALAGLTSLCALARLLPERDPHPEIFEVTLFVLSYLNDNSIWPALYVRWELNLLPSSVLVSTSSPARRREPRKTSYGSLQSPAGLYRPRPASLTATGCCLCPSSSSALTAVP